MQSHRLARLLRIIVEVREQPDRHPDQIAKDLGISTRQFYYDRNQLAKMGFGFSGKLSFGPNLGKSDQTG